MSTPAHPFSVLSGQLCTRTLSEGTVVVGVLALRPEFVPEEGQAYLMLEAQGELLVVPQKLEQAPKVNLMEGHSLSSWVQMPIWPKTTEATARVVRFIEAFPDANTWAVMGPSLHPAAEGQPAHLWQAIEHGQLRTMAPPIEARGMGLSQILTQEPVWPGPDGERYTLSQHPSVLRPAYLQLHRLMAQTGRDPAVGEAIRAMIQADPVLHSIGAGRLDPEYCKFLATLEDQGQLVLDGPRRADEVRSRVAAVDTLVRALVAERHMTDLNDLAATLQAPRPATRRRP